MAMAIGVCILVFSWLYAAMEPVLIDFTGPAQVAFGSTRTPEAVSAAESDEPSRSAGAKPTKTPRSRATQIPTPSPTSEAFKMTHRSNSNVRVNLRPQPSTDNVPVTVLAPSTPLQSLNQQTTGADGAQWTKVRTEDGTEGWLREGTFFPV